MDHRLGHGPRLRFRAALVVALMVVASACGSAHSYDELLAGEARSQSTTTSAPATSAERISTGEQIGSDDPDISAPTQIGSGDSSAQPEVTPDGSPDPEGSPGAACTGREKPIVLGSVGTQSGLIGSIIGAPAQVVQAWASSVNASGGLKCHRVKYILADDGGDPSRHQALVRKLVENDHVVAFLQMDAVLTGQASVEYLKARNIPVISSEGGSNWFYGNSNYFPVFSSGDPTLKGFFAGVSAVAKEAGATRVGTLNCIEASICSAVYTKAPGYATEFGVNLVYRGQGSLVQPDFTSACQSAKDAGVQVLGVALDGNSFLRLVKSCRSVGFRPRYVGQGLGLTPEIPKDPNTEGAQFSLQTIPWLETGTPIVAESERLIRKYAPGLPSGPLTVAGYVAAKVFERAVEGTNDPTTSAGILAGLRTVRDYDVGGATYPLTFTDQPTTMRWCVWTVRVEGGKWVSDGAKATACGTGG